MIQDIFPYKFDVGFRQVSPGTHDPAFVFQGSRVLMKTSPDRLSIPNCSDLRDGFPSGDIDLSFLFAIDEVNFFSGTTERPAIKGFVYQDIQIFRTFDPPWLRFAGITASHIVSWQSKNRFCGCCASPYTRRQNERALVCPACGHVVYPSIAPVVMVGVMDGERLLLVRHTRDKSNGLALIAGFVEIGETLEDAVRREVYEEVGLKIKNLRYYKSQPWAFSQSILSGFFAELDGPANINLDREELSDALWVPQNDLPEDTTDFSLTYNMINAFRLGHISRP